MGEGPWALIGLGNPGAAYAGHRHNVGCMALDAIAGPGTAWRTKFQGLYAQGPGGTHLLKPQTFMNESGRAAAALARFYKIPPQHIWVFHDDLDLAPGKVRVKVGGGTAGHNGLRSVAAHLGAPGFGRVRIGIGHPGHRDRVRSYVLSDFARADRAWLGPLLDAIAAQAPLLLSGEDGLFMTRIAQGQENGV
ncbi:MAG TPA: aminoacyl-tRNA hydrolase [Rhodospirillaceae bacterium]|nr:aminoacyl-tRNA hydrolase [Alphaproteobacteria bacterium]HBH27166.1 aminoacyl-tRNA hydrolase [Rhodospirillaceae bacterium]